MTSIINRHTPFRLLIVAAVALVVAYDLSHVYDAYQLFQRVGETAAKVQPLLEKDLELADKCPWPKYDQQNRDFPACMNTVLPNLKTSIGMVAGLTKISLWLSRHPEDKDTKALALSTMDRLWDQYRREDRVVYRQMDKAVDDLNESVLYRVFHGAGKAEMEDWWERDLKKVEVAVNDPALADKQEQRDLHYAIEDMQAAKPKVSK